MATTTGKKQAAIALAATAGVILAAGLGGYWLMRRSSPGTAPLSDAPATPLATASAPVAPPAPDPHLVVHALIRALSSDDPAVRQQAHAQLAQLPLDQFSTLRALAEDVNDPATAGLLKNRLDQMQEQLVLNPLPISLHVKDASLEEVADALTAALEMPSGKVEGNSSNQGPHYTIDLDQQPFWQAIREVATQGPLRFSMSDNLRLLNNVTHLRQSVIQGPFFFAVGWNDPPPQRPGTGPAATGPVMPAFTAVLGIDPRIHVLDATFSHEPLVDDLGNILYAPPPPATRPSPFKMFFSRQVLTLSRPLQWPAAPQRAGTRIPSIKAHAQVLVALRDAEITIDDVARHIGETFDIGDTHMTLKNFTSDNQIWLDVGFQGANQMVTVELTDAQGWMFDRFTIEGTQRRGAGRGQGGPYKMRLVAPQKRQQVSLDFEIKDLPLPEAQP